MFCTATNLAFTTLVASTLFFLVTKANNLPQLKCSHSGLFAVPGDCTKFYRCKYIEGSMAAFSFDCAPGTVWDISLSTCNYPSQVKPRLGCESMQPSSTTKRTTFPKLPSTTQRADVFNQPSQSTNAMPTINTTVTFTSSSTIAQPTPERPATPAPPTFRPNPPPGVPSVTLGDSSTMNCTEEEVFPHPSDCRRYIRCVDFFGRKRLIADFTMSCGARQVFDPFTSLCVGRNEVFGKLSPCPEDVESAPPSTPITSFGRPIILSNYSAFELNVHNCREGEIMYSNMPYMFYSCSHDRVDGTVTLIVFSCPIGYFYVHTRTQCVPVSQLQSNTMSPDMGGGLAVPNDTACPTSLSRSSQFCNVIRQCLQNNNTATSYQFICPEEFIASASSSVCIRNTDNCPRYNKQ